MDRDRRSGKIRRGQSLGPLQERVGIGGRLPSRVRRPADRDDAPLIDWGVFSALSALIIAFGAMAYALGLLAMWLPASRYTQDFILSWYVVSLMPNTAAAGIGIRWSLIGAHLPFVLLSLPLYFLVGWFFRLYGAHELRRLSPNSSIKAWVFGVSIVIYVALLVLALAQVKVVVPTLLAVPGLRYFPLPIIVSVFLLWPLAQDRRELGYVSRSTQRRMLRRAALLVLINFAMGFYVISTVGKVSRPIVQMSVEVSRKGQSDRTVIGELWTNTEGYWYVFDKGRNVCAMPSEDVQIVQIMKRGESNDNVPKPTSCPMP